MSIPRAFAQPNIILFQADQLAAEALRFYGNPVAVHPQIDRIAKHATIFDAAYCNFPLCGPSRSSMMTGQLASRVSAFDNAAELSAKIPTVAHYMRNLGYRTCLSGKMHFVGPDQLHGFEDRLTSDICPADFQWSANWLSETHEDVTDSRGVVMSGICDDSIQMRYDVSTADEACRYLRGHATSDDARPLFMTVSFTHPHDPFVCAEDYWNLYDHDAIPMPSVGPLADEDYDPHSKNIMRQAGLAGIQFLDEDIRTARHAYYGSISFIDDQIRKICDTLEGLGQADNTIIVFTSDHGEMLGERGMWFKKNFFEPAARIPLVIFDPRRPEAQRVAAPVSLLDLLPTLAAFGNAGEAIMPVDPIDGRSLLPLMDDPARDWNYPVYGELLSEGVTAPAFMVRDGRYKYLHSGTYPPMLFDLVEDPHELDNLAGIPAFAAVEDHFRRLVATRWDEDALAAEVTADQARRIFVQKALEKGKYTKWDIDRGGDLQKDWFRGQSSYNEWAFNYAPKKISKEPNPLTTETEQ